MALLVVPFKRYIRAALRMTLVDFDPWQTSNSAYGEWWRESKTHVPQVNKDVGAAALRKDDGRSVLQRKLDAYALKERVVAGDGNCQFRALADQVYNDSEEHAIVRRDVVAQLSQHPDRYCGYVPGGYENYVREMARDGCWGDHITLQAFADRYGMTVYLVTSYDDHKAIEVIPEKVRSERAAWLAFWAEIHYNSVVPK
uniref:OTU domain-containing protein n=1 Tax=Pyramimonas obovata TaxID=1411642 RepID=A0A7S0N7Y6_9CHLO|mmetsp:Transcript_22061/g.48412  ORF Transcript_22061/g.48412 Transcript_22061/m.48412 type:complete len:199 (+) Transcript_22061:275-871(+)